MTSKTKTIEPSKKQLTEFMSFPEKKPFVMVNLLKFKKTTARGESGRNAYERYAFNAA